MILPVLEYIHIPSDEGEAAACLSHLIAERTEIAARTERVHAKTGSARAALESLVGDGTFAGRVSDDEARYYEEEASPYETEERTRAEAEYRGRV